MVICIHLIEIETAIDYNKEQLADSIQVNRLTLIHANFRELKKSLAEQQVERVDVTFYDLGVSSPQFDDADRGFSYRYDAPLDMRMDRVPHSRRKQWWMSGLIKTLCESFIAMAKKSLRNPIARRIETVRTEKPIETTGELVELIKEAIPAKARRHIHPAKKVFQAIRIAVNDELSALEHH